MGHAYKYRIIKAQLVDWLRYYEDEGFWQDLARLAAEKNWKAFAKRVRVAWQQAGGAVGDLSFLDNSSHAINVWQLVNRIEKPRPMKKDGHLQAKSELMEWLWYYDNDQFWDSLARAKQNGWKRFAAQIKSEWSNVGGSVKRLNFLDNSQHCRDVYSVMFNGAEPQLPRQPHA
ncbi:unnamed protein product [Effrenium voratum]|uniref:Uncharacterized protein n=1 Tax=Effrenium voratum TaxID=2562239 RepID=A0AA36NM35_9DINO|nr:unnamed protein product [Effrenium voratum]CAJ1446356.1 unnamed protein product [Effrenium voratum]